MRMPRVLCLAAILLAASGLAAQEKALAGREWKVVKSEEAPPGTRILFAPDGKLTITYLVDGKPRELSGSYTVAGAQLTLRLAGDGRERVETRTIKKLTETMLVTEDRNRKLEELQR